MHVLTRRDRSLQCSGIFHSVFHARHDFCVEQRTELHGGISNVAELELELIQTQMAQKPMLRAEVYAHAMRASQNRKKEVRREKKV